MDEWTFMVRTGTASTGAGTATTARETSGAQPSVDRTARRDVKGAPADRLCRLQRRAAVAVADASTRPANATADAMFMAKGKY